MRVAIDAGGTLHVFHKDLGTWLCFLGPDLSCRYVRESPDVFLISLTQTKRLLSNPKIAWLGERRSEQIVNASHAKVYKIYARYCRDRVGKDIFAFTTCATFYEHALVLQSECCSREVFQTIHRSLPRSAQAIDVF